MRRRFRRYFSIIPSCGVLGTGKLLYDTAHEPRSPLRDASSHFQNRLDTRDGGAAITSEGVPTSIYFNSHRCFQCPPKTALTLTRYRTKPSSTKQYSTAQVSPRYTSKHNKIYNRDSEMTVCFLTRLMTPILSTIRNHKDSPQLRP